MKDGVGYDDEGSRAADDTAYSYISIQRLMPHTQTIPILMPILFSPFRFPFGNPQWLINLDVHVRTHPLVFQLVVVVLALFVFVLLQQLSVC